MKTIFLWEKEEERNNRNYNFLIYANILKTKDAQCNCFPITTRCPASPREAAAHSG